VRLIDAKNALDMLEREEANSAAALAGKLPLNPFRRYKAKCFLRGMRAAYAYAAAMIRQIHAMPGGPRPSCWVTGKGATYCLECGARPAFEDAENEKIVYPRWCHGCGCYMGEG
jgi:hypothetical protein